MKINKEGESYMKNIIFKTGTLALACGVFAATAQERSPFAPVAGADVSASQSAQVNATQIANPLLLNLSGTAVRDDSGQQLGQIQHLIVNPQGCVDMAILSLGGAKLVPIPWQLVSVSGAGATGTTPGRTTLTLNVDRQKLQQAPSFSMNQINQITQQQTMQQVFNFYGVRQQSQSSVGSSASQGSSITGGGASTNAASSSITTGSQTNQAGSRISSTNQIRSTNQFGARAAATNQAGASMRTNPAAAQSSATNVTGQLSPTGRTNGYPNRPSVGSTNTAPPRPASTPGSTPTNAPPSPSIRPPQPSPQAQK